jgi:phosphoribulokinase
MSVRYPVVAVTGSSGAGTTTVKHTFEQIFRREHITAAIVEGDAFHRFDRTQMKQAIAASEKDGSNISHFGPEGNILAELETLFRSYGESGKGKTRLYLHNDQEALPWKQPAGTFTPWTPLPENTDLLFYEGLHGGFTSPQINIAQHVDLLIGVVPVVNLEWIQKIHRDMNFRGHSLEAIQHTILRRMPDYVHHITPQFSRTDVNFQRVPLVDTSNPFISRDIPTSDESMIVIRFRFPKGVDFPYLLKMLPDSFMSRPNTIVCSGGKLAMALTLVLTPRIHNLIERKNAAFSSHEMRSQVHVT